jgi:hypothetical protein
MGKPCDMLGGKKECIQGFDKEICGEETTWKAREVWEGLMGR